MARACKAQSDRAGRRLNAMEPVHLRFGGGATETLLSPLVAVWMLIAIGLILCYPRKKAIVPFLLAVFTIPVGQVVVLGSLHFSVLRILILAGLVRRANSRAKFPGGFNPVDRMVVLWTVSALVILSLQWMNMQALIHNLGDFLDVLGGYLVVRFLIPDSEAIRRTIKALAAVCMIQGACMINEQITHRNIFGYLGGMSLAVTVRDGKIRSEGVMGCIYAGVFAGVVIPLFLWLWKERKSRIAASAGIAGAIAMVITSNASTSWMALGGGLVGLGFWPLRKQMRVVRWGLVVTLVTLHLVMKAPVWALIARVDLTGSSSSDHRYELVNNCILHFSDWWLLGYKDYNLWGWGMWDTCNQFVDLAVKGGLLTLACYIAIFSLSFKAIGTARKVVGGDRAQEFLLWCLGAELFAIVVASFGINFMAQLLMSVFPLLACISVATFETRQAKVRTMQPAGKDQFVPLSLPGRALLPTESREEARQGFFEA
jgi:hypothetical protein